MATTRVLRQPTGMMLEFRTEAGPSWMINVETLSRIFGAQARETLDQWVQERQEEDGALDAAHGTDERVAYASGSLESADIVWHEVNPDTSSSAMEPHIERMTPVTVTLFLDGGSWCALLGENLTVGVAGFGDSVNEAVRDLSANVEAEHRNWLEFEEP